MEQDTRSVAIPLLESSGSGRGSKLQTMGNIIVSIVGTGVLGLPFAFRIAGWLAASIGVVIVAVTTYYCMLLLVMCKEKLASESEGSVVEAKTYGDLGYRSLGISGRYLTETLIVLSQCGGAVAYLLFIGQNLQSVFHGLAFSTYIFLLVPMEIGLSWIGSLSALAPFSIFADVCNVLAMGIVVKEDIKEAIIRGNFSFGQRKAITSKLRGLPFAAGMAVFCFEGFGMTLSLESSMNDRAKFPRLLAHTFSGITLVYVLFGFCGYMAFGEDTRDIVTLNLPSTWSSLAVKVMYSWQNHILYP